MLQYNMWVAKNCLVWGDKKFLESSVAKEVLGCNVLKGEWQKYFGGLVKNNLGV